MLSGHSSSTGSVINANRIIFNDEGSFFENNNAIIEGGAFLLTKSIIILNNSFFRKCTSQSTGGALSLRESSIARIQKIHVSECFANIGAFSNVDMMSVISIENSYFQSCYGKMGILIFLSNGFEAEIFIDSSYFFNNTGENSLMYVENAEFTMINSEFNDSSEVLTLTNTVVLIQNLIIDGIKCISKMEGCVFSFIDNPLVFLQNIALNNIQSNTVGGFIYSFSSNITINFSRTSVIISENIGGFFYGYNSFINMTYIEIDNFKYYLIYLKKCWFYLENGFVSNPENSNFSLKTSSFLFD